MKARHCTLSNEELVHATYPVFLLSDSYAKWKNSNNNETKNELDRSEFGPKR